MKAAIRFLSAIAIVVSVSGIYHDATFESLLALVVSISAVLSTFANWGGGQQQRVNENSSGIQAGRDVVITDAEHIHKEPSKK